MSIRDTYVFKWLEFSMFIVSFPGRIYFVKSSFFFCFSKNHSFSRSASERDWKVIPWAICDLWDFSPGILGPPQEIARLVFRDYGIRFRDSNEISSDTFVRCEASTWRFVYILPLRKSPTHTIHVWYIYLHLVDFYIYHTWILWVSIYFFQPPIEQI